MAELWDPARHWDGLTPQQRRCVGIAALASAYAATVEAVVPGELQGSVLQESRAVADVRIAGTLLRQYPRVFDHPAPPRLTELGVRQCTTCGSVWDEGWFWPAADWCSSCAGMGRRS